MFFRIKSKLIVTLLWITIAGCSGTLFCSRDESTTLSQKENFKLKSLKGADVEFSQVQPGMIYLSDTSRKMIHQKDPDGAFKYPTSEIVTSFVGKREISLKDGYGFCFKFNLPEIEKEDYVIVQSVIKLPRKIQMGSKKTDILQASFNFNNKNSEKTEYIWFIFTEDNKRLHISGEWNFSLVNHGKALVEESFVVR